MHAVCPLPEAESGAAGKARNWARIQLYASISLKHPTQVEQAGFARFVSLRFPSFPRTCALFCLRKLRLHGVQGGQEAARPDVLWGGRPRGRAAAAAGVRVKKWRKSCVKGRAVGPLHALWGDGLCGRAAAAGSRV